MTLCLSNYRLEEPQLTFGSNSAEDLGEIFSTGLGMVEELSPMPTADPPMPTAEGRTPNAEGRTPFADSITQLD